MRPNYMSSCNKKKIPCILAVLIMYTNVTKGTPPPKHPTGHHITVAATMLKDHQINWRNILLFLPTKGTYASTLKKDQVKGRRGTNS